MGVPGLAWWARTNGFGKETKHEKTGRTRCNQKLVRKSELSARHCTPGSPRDTECHGEDTNPLKMLCQIQSAFPAWNGNKLKNVLKNDE